MLVNRREKKRIDVAGIGFDPITQEQLLDDIAIYIKGKHGQSLTVVKPYVEFFTQAWSDDSIMQMLQRANRVVADGVAVQWAASYLAGSRGLGRWLKSLFIDIQRQEWRERIIPERGAGVDATHKLLTRASNEGWRVGIFGGPQDSERTFRAIERRYPHLHLVGVWSGFYSTSEEADIIKKIRAAKPDILFVAQGFPRQERFIDVHASHGLAKVLIGEGGTFDFDSMGGDLKRAPQWLRKIGLEWFWRLLQQPNRWRRQLALPRFMWRIYKIGQQN